MIDIVARLHIALHKESAVHSPGTTAAIEAMRDAITEIEVFRRRLEAAHEHVEAADREVSYITGLQDEVKRLKAEVERLRDERDEWRQAAQVEAGLRREFQAEIERLRDSPISGSASHRLAEAAAEIERLQAMIARLRARVELADR